MAKINNNEILNMEEDWGRSSEFPHYPYSGLRVQEFIKKGLKKADQAFEEKIGYSFFNQEDATLYHFKDEDDYRAWIDGGDETYVLNTTPISFEGKLHLIEISPVAPSSKEMYFTKNAKTNIITTKVESFTKAVTDKSWEVVDEYISIVVLMDLGGTGTYTPIKTLEILSGKEFSIDIKDYLASGYNRVRINATGKDTGTVANFIYSVNLTSMYLSPSNFNYAKPFIEGKPYSLGGMNIGGDLDKTLHIKVTRDEIYTEKYEEFLGSATYPTFAYTFNNLKFPTAGTGVYHVDIWLEAFGVKSDTLSYNIICVSAEDEHTALIVSMSEIPETLYNYDSNILFYYCVYNGGNSTGSLNIKLEAVVNNNQIWSLDDPQDNVNTSVALKYERSIDIESIETNIQLSATVTYGNVQLAIYKIDNSKSYPAEQNGLLFHLNPTMRSNNQDNKDKIINAINSVEYNAEWTKMSWVEDGWITDNPNPTEENPGRACLFIPAYSKVNISYKPLLSLKTPITLEFAYKVTNSSDYEDPIITIYNNNSRRGIKITSKNILVHSGIKNEADKFQDYNLIDEEFLHIIVTIIPNYNTNYGNICLIYCNGAKVRSFEFDTIQEWDTDANIILGNDTADLYLYKLRIYDRPFDKANVLKNYLNSLDNKENKQKTETLFKSCTDDSGNIDYLTCLKNGYNTMVIEMLGEKPLPDRLHQDSGQCNLNINIHNIPEGELDEEMEQLLTGMDVLNQTIEGQGTTAMTYVRWNFRWKLGSNYGKRRITAKKNVASSMHSHKMGATRLFNYLHSKCVGENEAGGNVAVYQYPVFGFQKIKKEGSNSYNYKFIGLYTVGADKGDKKTFAYNDSRYKESIIHMEGSDHTPKSVGFDYPWEYIKYEHEQERGITSYDAGIGAIQPDGHIVTAWELGMAGEYETDNSTHNNNIKTLLDNEFKPAYETVYKNSPLIIGVDLTIDEINSNIIEWQSNISPEGDEYNKYEFWLKSNYNLYFYNQQSKQYEPTGVNMLEDLNIEESSLNGKSIDEINRVFINAREERFKVNWERYWHKEDCIFYYTFVLLLGLTDNFKKNTYPYKFPLLSEGGKWRWRGDDFDTLFDINNQGLASKSYSILVGEKDSSGSIYVGDNSAFFKLLRNTQKDEIKTMIHKIFSNMVNHPKSFGANTQEKLVSCIKYFFWDFAQNYFPPSAYNSDSEWTYEEPWAYKLGLEVNPLNQSLGGHYEAEKDWVTMRMLFCSSYFNFGAFQVSGYDDTSTGQFVYRGASSSNTYEIKTVIDFNPTVIKGSTEIIASGKKVSAGTSVQMIIPGGDDTAIYIQGLDWITDLGDLSKFTISSKNSSLTIASKRLQRLKLGDSDANLMKEHISNNSTIRSIDFGNCPSLEYLDVQNLSTLSGTIDLTQMPRLQEALLKGTSVTGLELPSGAKISRLCLPDSLNTLKLKNLKFLTNLEYNSFNTIESLTVENCDNINIFEILKQAYNSGSKLKYIRLIGFNYIGNASDLTLLSNLIKNINVNGENQEYYGLDNEGKVTDNPVLEGTITIEGSVYEEDVITLRQAYGTNLIIELTGGYYIKFEDPAFQQILVEKYSSDKVGLTQSDLDNIKTLDLSDKDTSAITNLIDLDKLVNLTIIATNSFKNCTISDLTLYNKNGNKIIIGNLCHNNTNTFKNVYCKVPCISNIGYNALTIENIYFEDTNTFLKCDNELVAQESKSIHAVAKNRYINNELLDETYTFIVPEDFTGRVSLPNMHMGHDDRSFDLKEIIFTENINRIFLQHARIKKLRLPSRITALGHGYEGQAELNDAKFIEIDLNSIQTSAIVAGFRRANSIESVWIKDIKTWLNIDFDREVSHPFASSSNAQLYVGNMYDDYKQHPITITEVNESLKTVSEIKNCTFYNMRRLEDGLIIPLNIINIGNSAFKNCKNFTNITIPDNVINIGADAFRGCTSLTNVRLGDSVISIGDNAFKDCNTLTNITIPESVKSIGNQAFSKVKNIYISNIASWVSDIQLVLGSFSSVMVYHYLNENKIINLIIPEGVTRIANYCFNNSIDIKRILIPDTVKTIGKYAFYGMQNLTIAVLGKEVEMIGEYAFRYIRGTTHPFTIISLSEAPPAFEGAVSFAPDRENFTIYVPEVALDAYKGADGWLEASDKILPIEGNLTQLEIIPIETNTFQKIRLNTLYYGIEIDPEYSIEGDGSITNDGILEFNNIGDITVTATYKGISISKTYSYNGGIPVNNGVSVNSEGVTYENASMSTVGFIPVNGATKITWGVFGGTSDYLGIYTSNLEHYGAYKSTSNPRTVELKEGTAYLKTSFSTDRINYAYVQNADTKEYLWKGANV